MIKKALIASAISILAFTNVNAQTAAPAAPAAAAPIPSPIIVVNMEAIVRNSDAGRDMQTKLNNIALAMNNEMKTDATAIEAERNKLAATPASQLQTAQFQAAEQAFNQKMQAFETKRNKLANEMQATREDALDKLQTSLDPVVKAVVASRNANIVLDSTSTAFYVGGVDATQEVISRLNAVAKTVNVTRIVTPTAAPKPAAGAPVAAPAANAPLPRAPGAPAAKPAPK